MPYQTISDKTKLSEAERVLGQWVAARNYTYEYLSYRRMSPEQAMLPSGGGSFVEEETPMELRCNRVMNDLCKGEHHLFRAALLEFRVKDLWIADCRLNGGWRDASGLKTAVDRPRSNDYIQFIYSYYGISKSKYYRDLRTLKNCIVRLVL